MIGIEGRIGHVYHRVMPETPYLQSRYSRAKDSQVVFIGEVQVCWSGPAW